MALRGPPIQCMFLLFFSAFLGINIQERLQQYARTSVRHPTMQGERNRTAETRNQGTRHGSHHTRRTQPYGRGTPETNHPTKDTTEVTMLGERTGRQGKPPRNQPRSSSKLANSANLSLGRKRTQRSKRERGKQPQNQPSHENATDGEQNAMETPPTGS